MINEQPIIPSYQDHEINFPTELSLIMVFINSFVDCWAQASELCEGLQIQSCGQTTD